MERLENFDGVRGAALFGKSLHITVDDATVREPAVRALLEKLGHKVMRAERIEPSLEDVFVGLIENYERQHPLTGDVKR